MITKSYSANTSKKQILYISIPVFFSNIAIPLIGIVDTGLMGNLGQAKFLVATSIAASVMTMIIWSFGFLRMGTVGIVAQLYGKSDYREIVRTLLRNFFFGILLSPIIYNFGLTEYQKSRILNWFSSDQSLSEKWNILQSEISIGSGGLIGEGFLNSKQNEFNFLPEADTDFIFSIYAEQFGFLGVLFIFLLVGIFIFLTTVFSMEQKRLADDLSPYFLGTYFSLIIGFSFLLNILMVSSLIPVEGLPLPFFTKGGSSLLCFSIMIGLIFSSRSFLK